jgi:hypothetical protein
MKDHVNIGNAGNEVLSRVLIKPSDGCNES